MKKYRDVIALSLCLTGILLPGLCRADESINGHTIALEPDQVVTSFHQALLNAMRTDQPEDKLAITASAVDQFFWPATIARISLGRHWRAIEPSQQQAYTALIEELISSTYAQRFGRFNGQRFTTDVTEPLSDDRVRVKTTLITQNERVSLDYQLQQLVTPSAQPADAPTAEWRIYDIVAGGVSDLSLKRSNYSALFKKGGLEAVMSDIRADILANTSSVNDSLTNRER